MVIKELLKKGEAYLRKAGIESAANEAYILLGFVLKTDKTYLIIHRDNPVCDEDEAEFLKYVGQRANRRPIKYITGHAEFMSLDFTVNDKVLIPRPDTETMVCEILRLYKNETIKILDLCCGSGCIGISLLKYLPDSRVVFADLSEDALAVTAENVKKHKVAERSRIVKSDALSETIEENFDIILSNPPYIKYSDYIKLEKDVLLYEPKTALLAGDDGLEFYKKIIHSYKDKVNPDGYLMFEVGYDQAGAVSEILKNSNTFNKIYTVKDLNCIDRVVIGGK